MGSQRSWRITLRRLRYTLLICRVDSTLRVTPAMEALLSDHVWSIEDLIDLWDRRSEVAA
jgi:hypothetical protein